MIPAITAAWAARSWISFGAGAVAAGLLIGVPAYFMVSGARETAAAATLRADIANQDADRWQSKTSQLETDVALQNEAAEAARADAEKAEAILRTVDDLARAESADLNAQIAKWKARANERPDQTCTLGPLDRDAVRVLIGP